MNTEFFWLKSKILTAIYYHDLKSLNIAIKNLDNINAILDSDNNTVLHLVAKSDDLTIIKFLLENNASIDLNVQNKIGNTPLDLIVSNNNISSSRTVAYLLANGAKN